MNKMITSKERPSDDKFSVEHNHLHPYLCERSTAQQKKLPEGTATFKFDIFSPTNGKNASSAGAAYSTEIHVANKKITDNILSPAFANHEISSTNAQIKQYFCNTTKPSEAKTLEEKSAEKAKKYQVKEHKKILILRSAIKNSRLSAENGIFLERRLELETVIDKIEAYTKNAHSRFKSTLESQANKCFSQWEWKALGITSIAYHTIMVCVVGVAGAILGALIAGMLFPQLSAMYLAAVGAVFGMPVSVIFPSIFWTVRKVFVEKKIIKQREEFIKMQFKPHVEHSDIFHKDRIKRNLKIKMTRAINRAYEEINNDRLFQTLTEKASQKARKKKEFYKLIHHYTTLEAQKIVAKESESFSIHKDDTKILASLLGDNALLATSAQRKIEDHIMTKLWIGWLYNNADQILLVGNREAKQSLVTKKSTGRHLLSRALFDNTNSRILSGKLTDLSKLGVHSLLIQISGEKFGNIVETAVESSISHDQLEIFFSKRSKQNKQTVEITLHLKLLRELYDNTVLSLYNVGGDPADNSTSNQTACA